MEYAWSPEASLALGYTYFNPSTDDMGRLAQSGDIEYDEKRYADAAATFQKVLAQDAKNADAWASLGWGMRKMDKHLESAQAFARAAAGSEGGHGAYAHYDAACEFALAGKKDDAFTELKSAFAKGYPQKDAIEKDKNLASLKNDPRAKTLTASN
jgi:tetratricopeptide (TPR) repeat protein